MHFLQLRASFNRLFEECSKGLIRGVERMQQHAAKAKECAAQLMKDSENEKRPELFVLSHDVAVKDLVSMVWSLFRTCKIPSLLSLMTRYG